MPTRSEPIVVSVVIPAFNEAAGIDRCLQETVAVMSATDLPFEVIVVDDGSDDETTELALQTARRHSTVRVVQVTQNLGKGAALVHGAGRAQGELVLFMDADLEVHPRQFALLYETLLREKADVVIGSKLHPDSRIEYSRGRWVLSYGYYLLVRFLFGLPVRDTQTGLKLFRAQPLQAVLPRLLVKRYAHDLENLVALQRRGARIVEAPVIVTRERAFGRIGGSDVRRIAQDTLAIWYRLRLRRWYDETHDDAPAIIEHPHEHPRELVVPATDDEALELPVAAGDVPATLLTLEAAADRVRTAALEAEASRAQAQGEPQGPFAPRETMLSAVAELPAPPPDDHEFLPERRKARIHLTAGALSAAAAVTLAVAVSNLLNVVFHFSMGRILGPDEYSLLGSLFSVTAILMVPTLALQAVIAREVASSLSTGGEKAAGAIIFGWLRGVGTAVIAGMAVFGLVALPLVDLLHIERPLGIGTTLIAVIAATMLPVTWGALQGMERFGALARSQILFAGGKLGAGLAIAFAGGGAAAIMFAVALASMFAIWWSLRPLAPALALGRASDLRRRTRAHFGRKTVGSVVILTGLTALTMTDLVAARIAFDPATSGAYNAASVTARLMLILPIAVTTIAVPRVAVLGDPRRERSVLLTALAVTTGLGGALVGLFYLAPGLVIGSGFGSGYGAGEPWLGPLGLAMLLYSMATVYAYHLIALGRVTYAGLVAGTLVLQIGLFAMAHDTPMDLVRSQIAAAAFLLVMGELLERRLTWSFRGRDLGSAA